MNFSGKRNKNDKRLNKTRTFQTSVENQRNRLLFTHGNANIFVASDHRIQCKMNHKFVESNFEGKTKPKLSATQKE